ncbi:MAG: hypothetical protein JNK82_26865 [Myxococcaceae bacterium]|nr:hypothetical protein [Myxococcaceae bacterium]
MAPAVAFKKAARLLEPDGLVHLMTYVPIRDGGPSDAASRVSAKVRAHFGAREKVRLPDTYASVVKRVKRCREDFSAGWASLELGDEADWPGRAEAFEADTLLCRRVSLTWSLEKHVRYAHSYGAFLGLDDAAAAEAAYRRELARACGSRITRCFAAVALTARRR